MKNADFIDLAIVVAVAENGTIGRDNDLPWFLPEDLKHFKRVTMGHPIVMGRNTFDSIGKALPGRTNIVVTRQRDWNAENVVVTHSYEEALEAGRDAARSMGVTAVMIIGGAEFYRQVLPQAQKLYLTQVHAEIEGDAHFPELDLGQWRELERVKYPADSKNPYSYSFVTLEWRK
ncbi:dihydrofolate reductase [Teredinibacter haidensis]|uniref:dihydrofolate reductase n=1 Tax=Teredinibacter haidensis TaxID=2731755 RepID=UPI000948B6C5|nr:dihydrofolate reductase [Teredinibacter haidensis]